MIAAAKGFAENIIHGKTFVWNYFLIGLTISIAWIFILYKARKTYFMGGEKRAGAILGQFFSIIVLTILLSVLHTYFTGKNSIYYKEAVVIDKAKNVYTGTAYVHLLIDGRRERFNPRNKEFDQIAIGDTILLEIGKGKTGFDIIYEFD